MGILSDNMKAGFRRAYNTLLLSRSLNPNPNLPSIFHKRSVFTSARRFTFPAASVPSLSVPSRYCAPVAPPAFHSSPPLQQQCEEGSRREQLQILEIRDVVKDIESIYCQMLAGLLIAKDPVFIPDIVQKSKRRTGYLKDLYKVLDEMLREQGPYSR
ncbi:hypothetical protein CFOL_v3_07663 [Cephalotus follicularis]|uniref:Uncharacterized protein n=1 Tax=Cephalotus follicularis TaxID=3775 RepID=A0A1Q3B8C2_CEPFO|nr:hypothetical protein CFOL_v3_07663 [Cephalotus follicularis]